MPLGIFRPHFRRHLHYLRRCGSFTSSLGRFEFGLPTDPLSLSSFFFSFFVSHLRLGFPLEYFTLEANPLLIGLSLSISDS